jgi:hypothetical protein
MALWSSALATTGVAPIFCNREPPWRAYASARLHYDRWRCSLGRTFQRWRARACGSGSIRHYRRPQPFERRSAYAPGALTLTTLSTAEARRLALAAQGFGRPRQVNAPGWRDLRGVVKRLGLLQIDSVNVLVRAHYLPLFSRLGPYDRADFDAKTYRRGAGALFEYWAHEASLLPIELHPLLRWRMARARNMDGIYKRLAEFARERRAFVEAVLAEVAARGPISASELGRRERRSNGWWSWDEGKLALEYLFWAGLVTTATRRGAFERVYDLTERVIPRKCNPCVRYDVSPISQAAHNHLEIPKFFGGRFRGQIGLYGRATPITSQICAT